VREAAEEEEAAAAAAAEAEEAEGAWSARAAWPLTRSSAARSLDCGHTPTATSWRGGVRDRVRARG